MTVPSGSKVAVVGSGVAGICSSYLISQHHEVTLFEAEQRIGGHTNTVIIPDGPDAGTPIDTGFIVLNDRTYPLLHTLLTRWKVPVRSADMSFGYFDERSGLMYGSRNLDMVLARRSNLLRPGFYSMVAGIVRFWRELPAALEKGALSGITLRAFCANRYSEAFFDHYLIPFAGAIWSSSASSVLDMPAELCARFFTNHGMLSYKDNPQWQTVVGGSHSYLHAFERQFSGTIRRGERVTSVSRSNSKVEVSTASGSRERFDYVVIATHADQALQIVNDPSEAESKLLGAWKYSRNQTVLHTDRSFLPPHSRGVASWNYIRRRQDQSETGVCVTYHMNTLQGLTTQKEYCVTLNPTHEIPASEIVRTFQYTHPVFDQASCASQSELPSLNGAQRTWFCGSYFRWGFHEDAVRAAVAVAADFGGVL